VVDATALDDPVPAFQRAATEITLTEEEASKILSVAFGNEVDTCGLISRSQALPTSINPMRQPALKEELTRRGLETKGVVSVLKKRLQAAMINDLGG
jgi:hypothetical protein